MALQAKVVGMSEAVTGRDSDSEEGRKNSALEEEIVRLREENERLRGTIHEVEWSIRHILENKDEMPLWMMPWLRKALIDLTGRLDSQSARGEELAALPHPSPKQQGHQE